MKSSYHTKQKDAIIGCLEAFSSTHVTISQISNYFKSRNNPIGLATIYRQLARLEKEGLVKKYIIDGSQAAYFEYMGNSNDLNANYHLKCEECGDFFHLNCNLIDSIKEHVLNEHIFLINTAKTVFYGKCSECIKKH